jgi:tetratricopeptide (TPR) repeat protein
MIRDMDAQTADELLAFAEDAVVRMRGADSKAAFAELDRRNDDVLGALGWYIDQGHTDDAMRLGSALVNYWMATKRMDEGSAWFDRILASPGAEDGRRGRASFDAGYLAFWQGDYERSRPLQERAVELGRKANDPTVQALALGGLARIALTTDVEAARRLLREAIAVTDGTDDRIGRSGAMHVLGVAAQMAGDFQEAGQVMRARIALGRETGNMAIVGLESGNLSMVERQLGNLEEAERLAHEGLQIAVDRTDELAIPWMTNAVAAVAAARGSHERAATLIGVADTLMAAAGGGWPPDELAQYEGTVKTCTAALGEDGFERIRAIGGAMTTGEGLAYALTG